MLWRKCSCRFKAQCRLNTPINRKYSDCSGDGAWPAITDEVPYPLAPPGRDHARRVEQSSVPGRAGPARGCLHQDKLKQNIPLFIKEDIFSISKSDGDLSQVPGGQKREIRPQQVEEKVVLQIFLQLTIVFSYLLSFHSFVAVLMVYWLLSEIFVSIVQPLYLYFFTNVQLSHLYWNLFLVASGPGPGQCVQGAAGAVWEGGEGGATEDRQHDVQWVLRDHGPPRMEISHKGR